MEDIWEGDVRAGAAIRVVVLVVCGVVMSACGYAETTPPAGRATPSTVLVTETTPTATINVGSVADHSSPQPVIDDMLRPRPEGILTDAEAVGRALLAAEDPEAALNAQVGVKRTSGYAPGNGGTDHRVTTGTRIVTVTVYAPIPANHSRPLGADVPDSYETYTIWFFEESGHGYSTCWGCSAISPTGVATNYVEQRPPTNR